jgi:hypothetical protein
MVQYSLGFHHVLVDSVRKCILLGTHFFFAVINVGEAAMVRRRGRRGWTHKQPQGGSAAELVALAVTVEGIQGHRCALWGVGG